MKGLHGTSRPPPLGMQIAGAALGGVLGATLGLRVTLLLGGLGLVVATFLRALSPIRSIRHLAIGESSVRP